MATLYLHIGTPKTGTSFMQTFLREHNDLIGKQGYVYPNLGMKFPGIGKARNGHFLIVKGETAETIYSSAIEKLTALAAEYENVILSEEGLWNNDFNIARFVKDMKALDVKVKILVYLRRQDLYLQSQWAQNVKESMTKDFYTFAQETKIRMNYYEQLCVLREIVGQENMLVRVYEKQQFSGVRKNLLSDFFETVGLTLGDEFVVEKEVKNPSLSGIYLETKRMLNRHPEFATKLNFVTPYLYAVAEKKGDMATYSTNKYFTHEQQMEFLSQFAECNEKIAKEFLGREDGILFYDEIVGDGEKNEGYKTEEYMDVMAEIVLMQRKEIDAYKAELKEAKAAQETFGHLCKKTIKRIVKKKK